MASVGTVHRCGQNSGTRSTCPGKIRSGSVTVSRLPSKTSPTVVPWPCSRAILLRFARAGDGEPGGDEVVLAGLSHLDETDHGRAFLVVLPVRAIPTGRGCDG